MGNKPNRNGVFIGGYLPKHYKDFLERRAKIEHKTVTEILKSILAQEIKKSLAGGEPNLEVQPDPRIREFAKWFIAGQLKLINGTQSAALSDVLIRKAKLDVLRKVAGKFEELFDGHKTLNKELEK